MDIAVILAAWHILLKRCVRFPHAYKAFSQGDCETEKISSLQFRGSAIQLESEYEDKQHAKY